MSYLLRPVGALLFGRFGDRFGRRPVQATGPVREPLRFILRTQRAGLYRTFAISAISDRIGRRTTLLWLCALAIALPAPMFSLMSSNSVGAALCGAVVLACTAGGITAVGASAAAEQFHPAGRLTGLALGATAATAVFGGLAPYLATLLTQATGWTLLPGALVAAVALSVLPVLARMPETSGQA